jgi:hypothetical protein
VTGSWKRLVFGKPGRMTGTVDKHAYVMCVLEQFHQFLRRREIYAPASTRWGDPRARLLTGNRWELAKPAALTALRRRRMTGRGSQFPVGAAAPAVPQRAAHFLRLPARCANSRKEPSPPVQGSNRRVRYRGVNRNDH